MKIKSKKNIKNNRKHSRKNVRKNKRSRKNVGKYSRKNVMRGGVLSKDLQDIIKRLIDNDRTLTTLDINGNHIGSEGAKALATALSGNETLTTIDIIFNNIGDEGAQAIAEALKTNTTLTKLNISGNNIGDAGAKAIAEALTPKGNYKPTLTTLNISVNNIGGEGAKAIAEALTPTEIYKPTLTTLDLFYNNIGDAGTQAIGTALKTNATLTTLNISYNHIDVTGAQAIEEALKVNKTLTIIDIFDNNIGNIGAQAIAEALKVNKTLTKLDISGNKIGDAGATAIATALSGNKTLTTLNIVGNFISFEIVNDLAEALERNKYQITYVPKLETLKNNDIQDASEFIDTILKTKDIIKNKTLNNTGKEKFFLEYKQVLSGSEDISNFKKLISNNYTNGNEALKEIDTSNKYIINLHGGLSNNIFKLPDNINIIFLTPNSYLTLSCGLFSAITLENIKQYIENPYCANNNTLFKEAVLYLGGQYCIDLILARSFDDGFATGIHYVSESKIEKPYLYEDGKYSFTLSNFLEIGKDHTHKMFEIDSQYTFIVIACREINPGPNQYECDLMNKLVLYEITIKILNFYLHFINEGKRAKMTIENNKNETIENKYNKCKTKKHKEIYLGSNKKLMFLQYFRNCNTKTQKSLVRSRNSAQIFGDTVVKTKNSSGISVRELKQIVYEIDDINKQEKFKLLSDTMNIYRHRFEGNNKPTFQKSIFLHEKQTFDIIKYIFQDKYDLMFEFIVYIDLKLHIINFGYFKDLKDLKTKIDVSKINYRINLSALKFIVTYLEIKNLITLNICCNKSRDYGIEEIIKTLENNTTITKIDISWNEFGDKGAEYLANMLNLNTTLTTLTTLDINRNRIGEIGSRALAKALEVNTTLTTLNISNNSIGNNGVSALATALNTNTTLTTLDINRNRIGEIGSHALATALNTNTTLTTLDINYNKIGDDGVSALAEALKLNTTLTILDISRNNIGVAGAEAIALTLKDNTTLTTLIMNFNNIGNAGATAIAKALEGNQKLEKLEIVDNHIGDEGAEAIANALNVNRTLTTLIIYVNNIGKDMRTQIKTIQEKKNELSLIRTNGNKIKSNGLENITQKLPQNAINKLEQPIFVAIV
jgi:Ran GTPase-activating protein (RanGAP) involved in mRNA processing and transport